MLLLMVAVAAVNNQHHRHGSMRQDGHAASLCQLPCLQLVAVVAVEQAVGLEQAQVAALGVVLAGLQHTW